MLKLAPALRNGLNYDEYVNSYLTKHAFLYSNQLFDQNIYNIFY